MIFSPMKDGFSHFKANNTQALGQKGALYPRNGKK